MSLTNVKRVELRVARREFGVLVAGIVLCSLTGSLVTPRNFLASGVESEYRPGEVVKVDIVVQNRRGLTVLDSAMVDLYPFIGLERTDLNGDASRERI